MRKKIVAGNWKMNGSLSSIEELLSGIMAGMSSIKKSGVIVCSPSVYLSAVSNKLSGSSISYGAQDICQAAAGAYTGEISGSMLNDFSCEYVIVGHSERRNGLGESNELVAEKFKAAQNAGITPILCVGESLEERETGVTNEIVGAQIDAVINLCGIDSLANSIVAYEPVWAIGTGKTASPEQAQETHFNIRSKISEKSSDIADNLIIQYGGSMNSSNAKELLSMPDIDGGLIGGASLKYTDFLSICNSAEDLS